MTYSIQQSTKHDHHRDIIINGNKESGLVVCDTPRMGYIVTVGFNGFPLEQVDGVCEKSIKKAAKIVADYYWERN